MAGREGRLAGVRVLVVEDEYFIADDMVRALRQCGAEPVGPVGSLADAEQLIAAERPDAVILDLNLRGEFAYRLIDQINEQGVPFLIVSGYSAQSVRDEFRDYPSLEKPVSEKKIVAALAKQLGRPSAD